MKRLTVGLMGIRGVGAEYLSALEADDSFELVGVADTDSEALRRYTESSRVPGYDDYRSLIVERVRDGLDLLVVALPPFQSLDFVELAARRGVAVFHKAPFARSVREGRKLIRLFDAADRPVVVSRFWQFEPAVAQVRPCVEASEGVYAVTADVQRTLGSAGWRGDSARAGGGVLLNGAYEQVDLLVQWLGLPDSVCAQSTVAAPVGATCPYDTEDAVQVLLRYGGRRVACITARRGAAASAWRVVFVGADRTIEVTGDRLTVTPQDGDAAQTHRLHASRAVVAAIHAFGASQRGDEQPVQSHAREHLQTLAVIEAAYLSAKTGEPESPDRFVT